MATTQIRINSTEYEFSHGAAPRGRGSWAFSVCREPLNSEIFWTPGSTTFGQAKKLARAHYVAEIGDGYLNGPFVVYVLP